MDYSEKYNLNRNESIFLAKKKWDENVYCGMKMENRNVTFPQTQTILNGVNVGSVALDDIQAILNMRDAWKYMLDHLDTVLDIEYICRLNADVSRNESLQWGVLRSGSVGISGTDYVPPVPVYAEVKTELDNILTQDTSVTERALDIFAWGTRRQLFWDGNKRTSLLAANKLLISEGKGILTIKEADMEEFNNLLRGFYDTGIRNELKKFLYIHAIHGIDFNS